MPVKHDDARSLIFLSCDLVGSTQFKQSQASSPPIVAGGGRYWQEVFLEFYRGFPQMVATVAKEFEDDGQSSKSIVKAGSFTLWKPIGDELVFTVEVKSEYDVAYAVRVWLETLHRYEADQLSDSPLKTKGGAFIATFPGPDSRATIPVNPEIETSNDDPVELNDKALQEEQDRNNYTYDYFGPSVDTGFRLFSACSHRYFTLSVEVVYAMTHLQTANVPAELGIFGCSDLVFLDGKEFKGVWNGREYPLFAIDRHQEEPVNKAISNLFGASPDPGKVKALAHACLTDSQWPSRLYLPSGSSDLVRQVPVSVFAARKSTSILGFETKVPESTENQDDIRTYPPKE